MKISISFVQEKKIYDEDLFLVDESDMKQKLHRSIGALSFLTPNKRVAAGSGVLISRNLILTAAHNLYDKVKGQENDMFKFYLGVNGKAEKYYELEGWRYPPEFTSCSSNERLQFDYALVKLKQPIEYSEFLQLTYPCEKCLIANNRQTKLEVFGYPIYGKNYSPLDKQGKNINLFQFGLTRNNRITVIEPKNFKIGYALTTEGGQSGCPIVVKDNIIAIHSGCVKSTEEFNVGRLITADLLSNLKQWGKQLKGSQFTINTKDMCSHISNVTQSPSALKFQQPSWNSTFSQCNQQLLQKAKVLFEQGKGLLYERKYALARDYFRQCLQIQNQAVGKWGRETAETVSYIGLTYFWQEKYDKARASYKQYVSIVENLYEEKDNREYAVVLKSLGLCYMKMKDFKSGIEYFEQLLLHNEQIQSYEGAKICGEEIDKIKNLRL